MRRTIASVICVCVVLGFPLPVAAVDEPSDAGWQRVRRLKPDTEIRVTTKGGKPRKHRFVRADETTLVVKTERLFRWADETLARDSVLEVDGFSAHPKRKGALMGLAIGAGITVGSMLACDTTSEPECPGVLFVMIGIPVMAGGAAIGGEIAESNATLPVIYRAPQRGSGSPQ